MTDHTSAVERLPPLPRPALPADCGSAIQRTHGYTAAQMRNYALAAIKQDSEAGAVAWIRYRSDGGYEGPIHDCLMDDLRRRSGAWTPLYPTPAAQPSDAVPPKEVREAVSWLVSLLRVHAPDLAETHAKTWHSWLERQLPSTPAAVGGDRLLWRVVANAGRLSDVRQPRWAHVSEATGHGSNVSVGLCREAGFNPDEYVGGSKDDAAIAAEQGDAR